MVKQQLRVLCFINYSHLPSSGGEGATYATQFLREKLFVDNFGNFFNNIMKLICTVYHTSVL